MRENWSSESRTLRLRSRDPALTTPLTGNLHLMLRSGAADLKIDKAPDLRCSQRELQLKDGVVASEHFALLPTSRSQGTRHMQDT